MITSPGAAAMTAEVIEEIRKAELAALVRPISTVIDISDAYPDISIGQSWRPSKSYEYTSTQDMKTRLGDYRRAVVAPSAATPMPPSSLTGIAPADDTNSGASSPLYTMDTVTTLADTYAYASEQVEQELLNWDAHIPVAPRRRTWRITVQIRPIGRDKPFPIDDPWAG